MKGLVRLILPVHTINNVASQEGGQGQINPERIKQDLGIDLAKIVVIILTIMALAGWISWEDATAAKEFLAP